ncbi:phospholipase [Actinoplanes sp. CA-030573]|uniref:phospholipase n=1 Tax=Actinoplanes sp. CA-030573 TaxID=3239898 RepID=UPI003D922D00
MTHHHSLMPSGQGTVMLNIGAGIGALVIHAPGRLHGHEIEVSPVGDPALRTHAAVRARYVRGGASYAVVIDSLPEGRYTVWRDPVNALGEVEVPGGGVAEFTWPQEAAAA